MKKVKTNSWKNAFYIQTRICVTIDVFTRLVCDYFWNRNREKKLPELTKKEAEEILRKQIRMYWVQWEFKDWDFESYSPEEWDKDYFELEEEVKLKLLELFPYLN